MSTVEGDYEYVTVTYRFPKRKEEQLRTGWRIGEAESAAGAIGMLMLDVLTLVCEACLGA